MAVYRQIQTSYWQDAFVLDLTPEEKFFYMYLMTNSKTTQCGIYELPKKVIEMETGYNRETVEKLLQRFTDYGKIVYSDETKEIFIMNWCKYNFINSKPVLSCIKKELKEVKNRGFVDHLYTLWVEYGYPTDTVWGDLGEEEEKEKEEEQEEEQEEKEYKNVEDSSESSCTDTERDDICQDESDELETAEDSLHYQAALYLRGKILEFNPKTRVPKDNPKDMRKWTNDMRLIFERDKRTREEVATIIKFIFDQDDFWKAQVQSPSGLRKHWDKIAAKMLVRNRAPTGQNKAGFVEKIEKMKDW
ncbi:MAG: hypothetical protein GX957_00700 [Clostridiaceae bacterium]|nr:hypothetical protein [Clostridiaceae bacterium]